MISQLIGYPLIHHLVLVEEAVAPGEIDQAGILEQVDEGELPAVVGAGGVLLFQQPLGVFDLIALHRFPEGAGDAAGIEGAYLLDTHRLVFPEAQVLLGLLQEVAGIGQLVQLVALQHLLEVFLVQQAEGQIGLFDEFHGIGGSEEGRG